MTTIARNPSSPASFFNLRKVLFVDAVACVGMGILLTLFTRDLGAILGFPEPFVFWAGLILFPCALLMAVACRAGADPKPHTGLVWMVIVGNFAWVLASALVVTLWFTPTALGVAFVVLQAIAVAVLACLEYLGIRHG